MANRRTYNDVINPGNNPSAFQNEHNSFYLNEQRSGVDTRNAE